MKKLNKIIREQIYLILEESEEAEIKPKSPAAEKESGENKDKTDKTPVQKPKKTGADPGTIVTAGAFGSGGRAKQFVAQAKARAAQDPEGLMEDLGVKSAGGATDLQRTLNVINQAIHANPVMSDAYSGATIESLKDQQGAQEKTIVVYMSNLDRKNGVRFMANTLEGAKNAGILSLDGGLQFKISGDDIGIISI